MRCTVLLTGDKSVTSVQGFQIKVQRDILADLPKLYTIAMSCWALPCVIVLPQRVMVTAKAIHECST